MPRILPLSFYRQDDVVEVSRQLLGKYLFTRINGQVTGGMIIETEAYKGPEDRAWHAFGMLRTKRNEMMYAKGGVSYIYLCYGLHSLFNIVTNQTDIPHAVLIRAIKPEIGLEIMLKRRNKLKLDKNLASGPGSLSQALGLSLNHNGCSLKGPHIWVEDRNIEPAKIRASPRIGIDYAGEDALLPWRFTL